MKVNPYNKRENKNDKKAFAKTEKTVKSVAKDTNKTRRKNTLEPLPNKVKREPFKTKKKPDPKFKARAKRGMR